MGGTATNIMTPRESALFQRFEEDLDKLAEEFVKLLEEDIEQSWRAGEAKRTGQIYIPIMTRFRLRSIGNRVGYGGDATRGMFARKVGRLLSEKTGCEMVVSCNWLYRLNTHEEQ